MPDLNPFDFEDRGWEGVWDIAVLSMGALKELKNVCGTPVRGNDGAMWRKCQVNLQTGEVVYPYFK